MGYIPAHSGRTRSRERARCGSDLWGVCGGRSEAGPGGFARKADSATARRPSTTPATLPRGKHRRSGGASPVRASPRRCLLAERSVLRGGLRGGLRNRLGRRLRHGLRGGLRAGLGRHRRQNLARSLRRGSDLRRSGGHRLRRCLRARPWPGTAGRTLEARQGAGRPWRALGEPEPPCKERGDTWTERGGTSTEPPGCRTGHWRTVRWRTRPSDGRIAREGSGRE